MTPQTDDKSTPEDVAPDTVEYWKNYAQCQSNTIAKFRAETATLREQHEANCAFIREVISFDGMDVDGSDIETWGEKYGVLQSKIATESDIEEYGLSEWDMEAGQEFFTLHPDIIQAAENYNKSKGE